MHALRTSVEMNSRTSGSTGPSPANSGTIERRTLAMREHARVSRIRNAWVQNSMTGFNISGVRNINDLVFAIGPAASPFTFSGTSGAAWGSIGCGLVSR